MCPSDEPAGSDAKPAEPIEGSDLQEDERRKHQRVALQLLIQYRFDTLEEFLAEYSTDISCGGMFIRTESPREEGSFVYLQFALRDGSRLIEGLGKVVRVNTKGEGDRVPGMGVEFVNLDEESVDLIEEIVARKIHPPA